MADGEDFFKGMTPRQRREHAAAYDAELRERGARDHETHAAPTKLFTEGALDFIGGYLQSVSQDHEITDADIDIAIEAVKLHGDLYVVED